MALENKLGITDSAELAKIEEQISKTKAIELFDRGILDTLQPGTFSALAEIHRYLFEDLYEFAGKIRHVNLTKGNFRFASCLYLDSALQMIEKMPQSTFDEIAEKYIEMNVAHPFREGNGRSMRIWLNHILMKELKMVVDWEKIDPEDYLYAMERSPVRDREIKYLLQNALTDQIGSRTLYMKGIDRSYAYEGYTAFRTDRLP